MLVANRANRFSLKDSFHISVVATHEAGWTFGPFCQNHVLATCSTEWYVSFAVWAVKPSFGNLESTERTRCQRLLFIVLLHRSTRDLFDSRFKLRRYFLEVLWSNQDTRPLIRLLLQTSLSALSDRSRHYVDHVVRELRDVLTNSYEESCRTKMIIYFDKALS